MSNSDLDYIESELHLTAGGGKYLHWPPTTGHWGNAIKRLESLRTVDTPPNPPNPPNPPTPPTPPPIPGLPPIPVGALLFSDEFNGMSIDTNKWEGKSFTAPSGTKWGGLNYAYLDGFSNLVITAQKSTTTNQWFSNFLAGRAANGFAYKGPRYTEARAKVPAGQGCFAAPCWEWASPWGAGPIEIDVSEELGKEPFGYHTTVHPWLSTGDHPIGQLDSIGVNLSDDFHIYGAAVYPTRVDFYFDGKFVYSADMSGSGLNDLTTYPVVPCIDLDMGGWGGPIDPAMTSATMLVDYFRVYSL